MTSFGIFWRSATSSKPTTSQIWTMPFWRPDMWPKRLATVVAPGEQRRVRRDLLDDVALAGAARAELDEVVVALGERDEPHQEEQLQPARHLRRARSPCCGRMRSSHSSVVNSRADAPVLVEVEGRDLDRRQLVDPERVLALRLLVVLEAHVELRPDAAHQQALVVADVLRRDVEELVAEVDRLRPVVGVDEAHLHLVDEGVACPFSLTLLCAFIDSSGRM